MNAKAAFLSPWRTIPKVFTGKKVGGSISIPTSPLIDLLV